MTTLYASIIKLHALHAAELRRDTGQWANAAFYGILHEVDPILAEALHQWKGRKPFTISALQGLPPGRDQTVRLQAGRECWLRVTTLGNEIFQPFIQRFLQGGARPKIKLGPLTFGVSEVLSTPGSHPWAGYQDAETLLAEAEPANKLSLEFTAPTRFNLGQQVALFPLPALVFGSLASRWNAFIAPKLDRQAIERRAETIMITHYELRTRNQYWKSRPQKGFTGLCTYDLSRLPTGDRPLFTALSNFAFYAGVGGKTTQGMGQTRRLVK